MGSEVPSDRGDVVEHTQSDLFQPGSSTVCLHIRGLLSQDKNGDDSPLSAEERRALEAEGQQNLLQ